MDEKKKKSFIDELTSMTKEEINDFIKKKGKKPKPIPLIYFMDEGEEKNENL